MATNVEFKLPNKAAFERATGLVERAALKALRGVAGVAVENAADLSPRRTGHNASTITWDEIPGGLRIYTQSGYGGFLELLWTPRADEPKSGEAGKPSRADGGRHYIRRGWQEAVDERLPGLLENSV